LKTIHHSKGLSLCELIFELQGLTYITFFGFKQKKNKFLLFFFQREFLDVISRLNIELKKL
jgi:hypothetical protein